MSKFKVGDKVKVLNSNGSSMQIGDTGVVKSTEVGTEYTVYSVISDNKENAWTTWGFSKYQLELVEPAAETKDVEVTSQKTITLRILEDEYELTEEESRAIIKGLKEALGE